MVEFCRQCGGSLARGDLTFWMGEMFTSSDYSCPFCGKTANPDAPKTEGEGLEPPPPGTDLVFRKGRAEPRAESPEKG